MSEVTVTRDSSYTTYTINKDEPRNHQLISSIRLHEGPGHDELSIWSRGGKAGEIVVNKGDGEEIIGLLIARTVEDKSIQEHAEAAAREGDMHQRIRHDPQMWHAYNLGRNHEAVAQRGQFRPWDDTAAPRDQTLDEWRKDGGALGSIVAVLERAAKHEAQQFGIWPEEARALLAAIRSHVSGGTGVPEDTARLDWWIEQCRSDVPHAMVLQVSEKGAVIWDQYDGLVCAGRGPDARSAIDAARTGTAAQPSEVPRGPHEGTGAQSEGGAAYRG